MADNRKYYYLKLKENYFDEDAIVLLENMQDGIFYSNILLKLYLKSLKNGGRLQLDENIPYTAQMIATITRQQVGTVERALQIFMKLGLVEPLQNGALYMSNIELLIGQSSTEGERKRRARIEIQNALPKHGADKCPPYRADICPPEIEIEKEIDIELEKERARDGTPRPRRLRQIRQRVPVRYGAVRIAGGASRQMGALYRAPVRIYRFHREEVPEPRRHHPQMGGRRYRKGRRKVRHPRLFVQGGRELMSEVFKDIVLNMAEATPEPEDYTGEDGLLYCGKCHTPKQFRMNRPPFEGKLFPHLCQCEQERRDREEAERAERKHRDTVEDLKRRGFTDPAMREWTFENDNGKCPQMKNARFYVEHFEEMKAENIGYLLWGNVGTGKSYFAGCIANALMEKEIPVRMTNFALILNDLTASFEGRNEYIDRLCRFPLLIIDDFGMERGTEYALEQVYNVIDSRYRSGRPLIVTTNLSLTEIQHPQDTPHARIYDRLLAMCAPVCFTGENFRRATAQGKLERLKAMMNTGKESL